jgi:endonuclease YncB( thermonuclease family)
MKLLCRFHRSLIGSDQHLPSHFCKTLRHMRLLALIVLAAGPASALAGDSLYGTVVAVKTANAIVLDYGKGQYTVRLVGVQAPATRATATQARQRLADLVLRKRVQIRIDYWDREGAIVGRVLTIAAPNRPIKDVGRELIKGGLVQKQKGVDYKYGELAAAEREARSAKRGMWRGQ